MNKTKCRNPLFYDPSLTPTGGLGSSYYLPIHFMDLNVILKKIIGGFIRILSFLVSTCEKIAFIWVKI